MPWVRMLTLIVAGVAVLCLSGFHFARTQSNGLRRITNITEEGININPAMSGDGKIVAFESTEDVAGAGGTDHFRAIRANVSIDPATFFQIGGTRAVAPAISQDGSRIAFASKDDPLGTNPDGNSEIFLFDGAKLIQVTNTAPVDIVNRVTQGNFQPSISDDGRFIAFSSNRDLASLNSDGNLEVFVYDAVTNTFAQLTNSSGMVGCSDAKISGNGASIAYIRDTGGTPSTRRDLLEQPRTGPGPAVVLAANVQSLVMTYGRAISDDGTRVVYSSETATDSAQVFLYDGRGGAVVRQITSLGVRVTEVPLHPTISGDGTRIAFATRRPISGISNSDNSIELYTYDTPTGQFARVTNAPVEADGFDGSLRVTEVVSSLNDDGTIAAFNFPRALSGPVTAGLENRSEIYVTGTAVRPPFATLTAILNGASFGNEPSPIKAIAPDSIAVARGSALANSTMQSQRLPNGSFPTNVGGTSVTVNGRAAQIFFISPGQVNFLVPPQTEIGSADVVVTNSDNFSSRGTAPILRAAPGIFTKSGDGLGQGMILSSDTLQEGPFDPSSGNLRLTIFATGARNASQTLILVGGRILNAESVIASPDMAGLDEVRVRIPADLRGAGTVNLTVQSDGRDSNPVTVTFTGDPSRAVFVNEVLADPPDGIAGDANHDGTRDGTQDEFVELVNGTASDAISVGGWTVRTRPTGSSTETTRFTFAAGTSLAAGEAIVVFGGGGASFNPNDGVFGCAQVVKATLSAGLSLTNGGLSILIRDGGGNLITQFTYGGSTGLDGDNNQSLTRSPDITGNFVQHTSAAGANGRRFSPGLKTDGTPFGACPRRLSSVTISPPSTSIVVGQTAQFTAQGFDQFGQPMTGLSFNFVSDATSVATVDSVSTNSGTGIATANVSGHNPGTAHITASASDGVNTVNSSQSTLTVNGPSLSINDVSLNEGDSGTTTFSFTVSLSTPAPAPVTFNIATADNTATVANNDYVARSLTNQTIPTGQQTYTFDVAVNGDLNIEANESFFVAVSNVSGASVGDGQGLGTILTDDSPALSINDVSANEGNSGPTTFTFTVSSTLPAPAGGITFDIATADGTATATSGDYVSRSLTSQTIPAGQQTYTFDVTVNGDALVEANETFFVNISNVSANATVADSQGQGTIQSDDTVLLVISQVYGGGNNSGAPFRNDFVEIYNRGTTSVDFSITPYSIQYAGVGSNFGGTTSSSKTNLTTGVIAPGQYFLVQEDGGTTNGVALPTPDATGSIAMGSTSGKVALVAGTTALTPAVSCPADDGSSPFNPANAAIADFVGYGGTATTSGHCYEGAAPAAAPSNTTADFRKAGGCVDTNENGADFFAASPSPRNSASPIGDCKPEITINDVTVTEGNSSTVNATFTVSLSAASAQTVTVNFVTADGTAVAPDDYQTTSGLLTFNPGDLTKTITVLVNGDTLDEANENFLVNLSSATNAVLLDPQGQGTITDNDAAPSLSINDLSIAEGDSSTTQFTFTVSLSTASGQTVTVNFATADGTAALPGDYQSNNGLLTFNPGDTSKPVTVLVNGDTTFESNETFFVNLTGATNASISDAQGQGTITNDDAAPPTPTFFVSDASVLEGNTGTTPAVFNVSLSPASAQIVQVDFATLNGTATLAGNDYQTNSGTLTFNPGDGPKQITVLVNGDTLVEQNETFAVHLSNATNGAGIGPDGVGTIQNDDTADLVISQTYPGGGLTGASFTNDYIELFNQGSTTVDFAVTPYSVQFLSTSASAWTKTDLTSGTLAPGRYFLVKETSGGAAGAALPTADATGSLNLTSTTAGKVALVVGTTLLVGDCPGDNGSAPFNPVNGTVVDFVGYGGTAATASHCYEGSGPASYTLSNNTTADFRKFGGCQDTNDNAADFLVSGPFPRNTSSPINNCAGGATPNLTINDVTVTEGNSGTTTATFTVSLSAAAQGTDVSFDIATADGTAQDHTPASEDNDYVAKSVTTQVIPAGQTTYTFTVSVNGDAAVEPNETFLVNVTNVVGANLTDGQAVGTIQNDDSPALSIDDVSAAEGNGTTTFTFHVTLSAPAPATVTFDIATADGTAQDHVPASEDNDYQARSIIGQTIAQGSSSFDFAVTVNGDVAIEPNETFFVNVTNVSGATLLDGQGVGTIQNDDSPILNVNDVSMAEGNTGTTTFTFTVTSTLAAPAGGITFDIATADGTAQDHNPVSEDNDYVARSLTSQSIPVGQTTYSFEVTVNGDKLVESDETFFVNVTNATNASIGDGVGQGTIQNDDTANLVISQIYGGGNNSGATFQNDFVEMFNRGTTTINFGVTPYSVQYASSSGTFSGGNTINLNSGNLVPGQYYLVKLAGGTTNGVALPTEDASNSSINMANDNGKVALVVGTTVATTTGGCPTGVTVADLIGYGSANCSETAATAALSATKSALRKTDGCTDTDNNLSDFTTPTVTSGTPPRNSASAINDCNAPPNLSINDITLTEGNGGTKLFTFTVSLSKPALAGGVTFDIATAPDTAAAGSDYAANSATGVSIGAGSQTATFDVTVNGDTTVEADETFLVNVTNVTGATVVDGQGVGTIQNDDTPSLSINDVTHNEGNSSTTTYTFTVTLAPASNQTVTVNYATADVTATAGSDYTAILSTQLTFLAGETTKTFDVTVSGDTTVEPDETFVVNLSGATNANVSDSQGVGTLTNDDGANVVISQIYGGGSNSGATYNADYVELLNRTSTAINITTWSVQYQAATTTTGAAWSVAALCPSGTCTIPANSYYLVRLTAPGATGAALPTPDSTPTNTINMAATAGKVALVNNSTALTGTSGSGCPSSFANIIDLVGYGTGGSGANCFEGASAAPTISATLADFRKSTSGGGTNGCFDSNNNNTDFSSAAPLPRNSSTTNVCP